MSPRIEIVTFVDRRGRVHFSTVPGTTAQPLTLLIGRAVTEASHADETEAAMAETSDDVFSRFQEKMRWAEETLGVPLGTLSSMLDLSDWALAIQLSAMIEGALGHAIRAKLNDPRLDGFVDGLSVRGKLSKLALARSLELVDEHTARAIEGFAGLRNFFAHDYSAIGKSFHIWLHEQTDASAAVRRLISVPTEHPRQLDPILMADEDSLREILWTSGVLAFSAIVHAMGPSGTDARLHRAIEDYGRHRAHAAHMDQAPSAPRDE